MLRWAGKPARDDLKSLPESEFKYEGASAEAILTALEKTKPKSNEIAAFTKLSSLKQEDMPLSEFIWEVRRLVELCNYPNDQDRLIRDMIVSGIKSYEPTKSASIPDLSLQDCINICQVEDAIRMQVQECRPESVNSVQSAQTMMPVHRLQHGSKQSSNFNRHKNKSTQNCYYCGAPNWTREHSKVCKAKKSICGKCGKKGHLDSLCRSSGTPVHMLEVKTTSTHSLKSLCKTITRGQRLHNTPHRTSYQEKSCHKQNATASRLYKSPDWVPMNRVNISNQHGLHSLKLQEAPGGC